ncbi:MAG: hypothetical protein ACFFCP_19465 [Promethearchaeota archaeon]
MKSIYWWLISFCIVIGIVLISILFPTAGASFSNFSTEIIGTFLGFGLAISFAEIAKHANDKVNGDKLAKLLTTETRAILRQLEVGGSEIKAQSWKLAISTGQLVLLDEQQQANFLSFFGSIEIYNQLVLFNRQVTMFGLSEDGGQASSEAIQEAANGLMQIGKEIIIQHGE